MKSQSEIRDELKRIREDPNLSEDEKRKRSQYVLARVPAKVELTSNYSKDCPHYKKKCSSFVFECCGITDPCNRCHQARECCKTNPPTISSIKCDDCETVQIPSPNCTKCGIQFAKNHCSICKIWTPLDIVHCFECGICRVGKQGENFHCVTCDACFSLASMANHVCSRKTLRDERCCYCLECVHTSQKSSVITQCCGIGVHQVCVKDAAKHGNYRCPRCRKSIFDMSRAWDEVRFSIAAQPLPDDMFTPVVGMMFNTSYGPFRIDHIAEATVVEEEQEKEKGSSSNSNTTTKGDSSSSSSGGVSVKLYSGVLVEWVLSDETSARATLSEAAIHRGERMMHLWCNECERKSLAPFHFLGMECKYCRGFNTSKA